MIIVQVDPGVCGLKSTIRVTTADNQNAKVTIESNCPHIQALAADMDDIDAYRECFSPMDQSGVYQKAAAHCKHTACPVPSAIIKGVEAACGLALPRDVVFTIEKE